MARELRALTDPLLTQNPVTTQVLGICSALAVTSSLSSALVMGAALSVVTAVSSLMVSLIRRHVPVAIRLILQITIVASLVIVVDQVLLAYAPAMSRRLTVFVGLIVTNCIVLGRTEAFAMRNPPLASLLDGLGSGLGYGLVLACLATVRELLGAGTLLGYRLLTPLAEGGGFRPLQLMLLPSSAFFLLGLLIWSLRTRLPEQAEPAVRLLTPRGARRASDSSGQERTGR
jgi:Na+-transporting NADH:ubiquinone oxidoreductase subunit D